MKRLLTGILTAAALAGGIVHTAAAQTTIKLGHVTQTSHPFHTGAALFKEAVEQKTDGELKVQIFPARQLGDDKQLLEGVRLGTVDAAVISSAVFSGFTPVMDALQLPFLIESYDELADAFTSPVAQQMLDSLDGIGLKGLGYYEGGLRNLLVAKKKVTTLEGMKGLKARVVPAKLHLDIWNAVDASPTPMAYGEIYTSLQTGVLDGAEINTTSVYSEKLYEVADHLTRTKHYFWPAVVVVNPRFYNRLSDAQQQALVDAARETVREQVARAEEQEVEAEAALKAEGFQIHELEDRAEVLDAVAPVIAEYSEKHPLIEAFVKDVQSRK
ncbi:TRAP transporter substrate-binding protein [Alkalilimnicola sp. S0819]|uniref:TRAP transporter substrate-binding protein n=1 Tax=Alkalilimnicola sp. S0819 TaxID=2613922 RepID=UPI0012617D25|nr:TRAP transporter substrate-binding protein [Alkalilimnicola sp. S0819]KAB7623679.1 TRAP transporter substrate-binding protein [Alkalilimnicola sp. S0819]MPQ16806.1 DctP family TRAP transporter solute-binding subunit [Alkalilimnicola sp. S0819]